MFSWTMTSDDSSQSPKPTSPVTFTRNSFEFYSYSGPDHALNGDDIKALVRRKDGVVDVVLHGGVILPIDFQTKESARAWIRRMCVSKETIRLERQRRRRRRIQKQELLEDKFGAVGRIDERSRALETPLFQEEPDEPIEPPKLNSESFFEQFGL